MQAMEKLMKAMDKAMKRREKSLKIMEKKGCFACDVYRWPWIIFFWCFRAAWSPLASGDQEKIFPDQKKLYLTYH